MHCCRRKCILANNRKEGIYNGCMYAFAHVYLLCYYITIHSFALDYINNFPIEYFGNLRQEAHLSLGAAQKVLETQRMLIPMVSGTKQKHVLQKETNRLVSYTEWNV